MLPSLAMTTEVWCRNPKMYIREVLEVRHSFVVWDRGFLVKNSIDPVRFCDLYYPQDMHWRALVVGDSAQGAVEVSRDGSLDKPDAVYPVWAYGEDWATLEEMAASPVGENPDACSDPKVPVDERPVLGQEHRIVIVDIPNLSTGPGRKFIRVLHELQLDYPECIIHVHGLYSWRAMFGFSFRSTDIDGRTLAAKGEVMLPNGKSIKYEQAVKYPQWVNLLGMKPVDLSVPRNRCMYNIRSALWAAKNFEKNVPFKSRGEYTPDTTAADSAVAVPTTDRNGLHHKTAQPGDKFVCDTCSLQDECKFYRQGAVCSVPDSEPTKLSQFFNTRDSDTIIQGLGALLGKQADRLEQGLEDEEYGDELDPEVSKLINSLFANGVKLAKLTNPELAGGTKVGVFVNGGSNVAVGNSASQLTANIVRELEAKGIAREDITPEMIGKVLAPDAQTRPAIEAHAVTREP